MNKAEGAEHKIACGSLNVIARWMSSSFGDTGVGFLRWELDEKIKISIVTVWGGGGGKKKIKKKKGGEKK